MGASASLVPMQVDKETFRRLSGGSLHDSVFDKHAVGGLLTRDQLLELGREDIDHYNNHNNNNHYNTNHYNHYNHYNNYHNNNHH